MSQSSQLGKFPYIMVSMKNNVRLLDVANAANVSLATASKALNGTGRISARTRRLVLQKAENLGYHRRPWQHQTTQQSGLIGLVSSDLVGRFSLPVITGAERTLGVANHAVLLMNSRGNPNIERDHIDQLAARGVDGLLILNDTTDPRTPIRRATSMGVPTVYVYGSSTDHTDCSITCDNVEAGSRAIDHLVRQGRSRIVILAGLDHYVATRDRLAGASRALAQAGLELVCPTRFGDWHEWWGRAGVNLLISEGVRFDALYCLNDMIARGAIETLTSHGIRVPDDVAVIGHDNWDVTATESSIPISSFDNNLDSIGRISARFLLDAIRGKPHTGVTLVNCTLHERESTLGRR